MTSPLVDGARRPLRQRVPARAAPDHQLPQHGMPPADAMRLLGEELVLDGIPMRNLATFVTTWMEPEAQRVIADNLHRNYIDHAEYPQTAEIEQRCIRMLADLFHAPGRDDRHAHAGLLGGDHARRAVAEVEVARAPRGGGQGHRPAEPRLRRRRARRVGEVLPLLRRRAADHPAAAATSSRSGPRTSSRTSTRTRSASPPCSGTTFTGHADDIVGHQRPAASACATRSGLDVPLHVDGASGGFVWPFLYPDSAWDFRLEQRALDQRLGPQVRARLPGHRLAGLPRDERPGRGPRLLRELPRQARRDVHAELLHRLGDGARAVLQLRPLRPRRLPLHHGDDAGQRPRAGRADRGHRRVRARRATRAPSSCRSSPSSSPDERNYDEFDVASQLAAERGWMVPAYTLPPNAEHVTIMRALVKQTLGHSLATHARRRHRRGVRDARRQGRPARARPPARQDRHRLLKGGRDVPLDGVVRAAGAHRRAAVQARARADRPEPALADGRGDDQRRRLRPRLVRRRARARASTTASRPPGATRTCASSRRTSSRRCSSRTSARRRAPPSSRRTAIRSATAAGCSSTTASSTASTSCAAT